MTEIYAMLVLGAIIFAGIVVRNNRIKAERKKVRLTLSINRLIKRAEVEWDTYGDAINLFGRKAVRIHPAEIAIPTELLKNYYDEIKFTWEGGIAHVYTNVTVGEKVRETQEGESVYQCSVLNCASYYYRTST